MLPIVGQRSNVYCQVYPHPEITTASVSGADIAGVGAPGVLFVGLLINNQLPPLTGSVYVYQRDVDGADNWGLLKILTADDGAIGDLFGFKISVNGDRLLVGAIRVE